MKSTAVIVLLALMPLSGYAQIADGLYNGYYSLLHHWDMFVIVKNDTAYVEDMSLINGAVAMWKGDSLIKQDGSLYKSARHLLAKEEDGLFLVTIRRNKNKNRYLKLTNADDEITSRWNACHNTLAVSKIYDQYTNKLNTYQTISAEWKQLTKAYEALSYKIEIDQGIFLADLEIFKKQYLESDKGSNQ